MENTIKSFVLLKNQNKKEDKHPDYRISAKIGDKYQDIGAAWIKEKNGNKFLSCQLSNPRDTRAGYHIEPELPPFKEVKDEVNPADIPF
jgi:Protein of unknown function (DUF736).